MVAGCGWFDTQEQAQSWYEANQDFGQEVDGNNDGVACGSGDFGGLTDCNFPGAELVLARLCPTWGTLVYVPESIPPTADSLPREPTAPSADPSNCRTPDVRDALGTRLANYSVGFPLEGNTPTTGNIRVALIPVDFPEATGTQQEISDAEAQILLFNEWVTFQSRSTLTVNWTVHEEWLRASMPSSDYGFSFEANEAAMAAGVSAAEHIAKVEAFGTEMVALADPFIDFTDNQFVYFLFPKTITGIDPHIGNFDLNVPSDEGPLAKMWGGGAFFYRTLDYYQDAHELWSVWVHEIGHTWGLAGHAPVAILGTEQESGSYDTDLHLMGTQDALHKVFSVWDQWLLGWLPENEVYCLPASQLDTTDVELVALERSGESGYRTAMVPLTESSILVVESHRSEGYGVRAAPVGNAVVVYVVDTTLDYDRSLESGGGIALDRFAFYLAPSLTDAERSERGPSSRARRDPFLILGESVTYEGVTVTVVQSDEHDVVRITRNG